MPMFTVPRLLVATTVAFFAGKLIACMFATSESRYGEIMTIALVPQYAEDEKLFTDVSEQFNLSPTAFVLDDHSLPHLPLMHFFVPNDLEERHALLQRLSHYIQKHEGVDILINNLATVRSRFIEPQRLLKEVDGHFSATEVIFNAFAVEKTPAISRLQQQAIAAVNDAEALITPRGEAFKPHIPLAVGAQSKSPLDIREQVHGRTMFFRTAVGATGPHGEFMKKVSLPGLGG